VIEGILDHGYRGELFVGITNLDPETPALVKQGERLAQMIPHTNFRTIEPIWVAELTPHERGDQGFGSSGE
jgi:dUTPase